MNYNTTLLAHDMYMDSRSREETLLVCGETTVHSVRLRGWGTNKAYRAKVTMAGHGSASAYAFDPVSALAMLAERISERARTHRETITPGYEEKAERLLLGHKWLNTDNRKIVYLNHSVLVMYLEEDRSFVAVGASDEEINPRLSDSSVDLARARYINHHYPGYLGFGPLEEETSSCDLITETSFLKTLLITLEDRLRGKSNSL